MKWLVEKKVLYTPYHNVISDNWAHYPNLVHTRPLVYSKHNLQWQCVTSRARKEWSSTPYTRWRISIPKGSYESKETGICLIYAYINKRGRNVNLLLQRFERDSRSISIKEYRIIVETIPLKYILGSNFNTSTKRGLKKVAKRIASWLDKYNK